MLESRLHRIRPRRELVERADELRSLADAVARATDGHGELVVVEGEAGIGKSSLLKHAADEAEAAGATVLRAQGHEVEREFGFGVVLRLLGPLWAAADDARRTRLLSGAAAGAGPLLDGDLVAARGRDIFPVLHALTWLVTNLAAERPLVLCVDDAHAADDASLRFLRFLATRIEDLGVTVIVATRPVPSESRGPAWAALRSAAHRTVRPARLTIKGVGWVVAGRGYAGAAPEFVSACATASAGNPLMLHELLVVLADHGVSGAADGVAEVHAVGPRAVADSVSLALAPLGTPGVALTRALAILDGDVTVDVAAEVASLDAGTVVRVARALVDAEVLATGERLGYAHPVVRTAIAEQIPAFERAYLHGRAARTLHDHGSASEQVVPHLLACEPIGERWVLERLRDGARRSLASGAPDTAVQLLTRARKEPGVSGDALLIAELAAAQVAAGDPAALATISDALADSTDPRQQAELWLLLGRTHLHGGRYRDAVEAFDRGRTVCPGDAVELAADLRSGWASSAMWLPDGGAEFLASAQSTILGVTEPRSGGERTALAQFAGSLLLRGRDRDTAVTVARRAWGDGEMLTALGPQDAAAFTASAVLADADAIAEAEAIAAAIETDARRNGLLLPAATASYVRGSYLMMRGRLPEAAAAVDDALDAEQHGWGTYAAGAHWVAARIALLRGERARAEQAITIDDEREAVLSGGLDYAALPLARGLVALDRGDAASAVAFIEDTARRSVAFGVCIGRYNWRPPLVWARLANGDEAAARELAEENLTLAEGWQAPFVLGAALRALAGADRSRRLELLAAARDALAPSGERIEQTLVDLDLGRALAAADDREGALAALRSALDRADACGAQALAAQARDALLALGARPRRARSTGVAALTPAELRVAELARDGRSNREIAEHLFVTIKAVKWHLGNTYRKLGISSRAELADAWAASRSADGSETVER